MNWEKLVSKKVPGRLIFTSSPDRGLSNLLYCLPYAKEYIPELELHVTYGFHNWEKFAHQRSDKSGLEKIAALKAEIEKHKDWVIFHDRLPQPKLAELWHSTYVWCYLDTFWETYCLSAKEAQCTATPIVTSNVAALETTVGDYGIRIKHHPYSKDGRQQLVDEVVKLHQDRDYWIEWSKRALAGSDGVSWDDRWNNYWSRWLA